MIKQQHIGYKVVLVLGLFLAFVSCDDKQTNPEEKEKKKEKKSKVEISKTAIEDFKYNDYILSADAEQEVLQWSRFQELATQISYLKTADVTFFASEKDTLKAFIDSLRVNIPENLNTNPINARITALETRLLKLNEDLNLGNYPSEEKLKSIKELLIANSNLIFFINKKLEFDKNDVGRPEGE